MLIIMIAWMIAQTVVVVVYGIAKTVMSEGHAFPNALEMQTNGFVLALGTIIGCPVAVGTAVFFAWLRKGIHVKDYLAWNWPGAKTCIWWCLMLLALVAANDGVTLLMGRPLVPDVMVQMYQSAKPVWPLWVALLAGAPVAEETMFRGFLFAGLRRSRLSGVGAVIIASAAWSALHLQYDAYGMFCIFLSGLLLGFARLKTDSLPVCMLMHSLMNLAATIEVVIVSK